MENGIHHIRKQYTQSLADPVVSMALYKKMQGFGATLEFNLHFFVFNGIIQTIWWRFQWKCTGVLSSENNDFKFIKTAKNLKARAP